MNAQEQAHAAGFVNGYDVAKKAKAAGVGTGLYVAYRPGEPSRLMISPAWQVVLVGFDTDPKNWRDGRHMTFDVTRQNRQQKLFEAQAWADTLLDKPAEWSTVPGLRGYYFPKPVAEWAKSMIRRGRSGSPLVCDKCGAKDVPLYTRSSGNYCEECKP